MKQSDIEKVLILLYESSNHQMYVNWTINVQRTTELCKNEKAKRELVNSLRELADHVEQSY